MYSIYQISSSTVKCVLLIGLMLLSHAIRSHTLFRTKILATLLPIAIIMILLLTIIRYDAKEINTMNRLEIMARTLEKEFSEAMKLDQELSSQIRELQHHVPD